MNDFEAVKYFTDIAFQIGGMIVGLLSLHAAVLLAAVGWAISERSKPRGPGPAPIAMVALMLALFCFVNFASLHKLYGLANAALAIPRAYWETSPLPASAKQIFEPFGQGASAGNWRVLMIAIDALAIMAVCVLLSNVGRPQKAS